MTTEEWNPGSAGIDRLDALGIVGVINDEDQRIAGAVRRSLPEIAIAVDMAVDTIESGGRAYYLGAGTSGRIGMIDASECPPTFNSPPEWFQFIVAGGAAAMAGAREEAEDEASEAAVDLDRAGFGGQDLLVGISASGRTPYTLAGIEHAARLGARTVALVSAPGTPMADRADLAIVVQVGPEIIAGSTRMKAGTAQKMVLNMLSTAAMVRMGMTYDNWMINVHMTNDKLRARGARILQRILGVDRAAADALVGQSGGELKVAVVMGRLGCDRKRAEQELTAAGGSLRRALGEL